MRKFYDVDVLAVVNGGWSDWGAPTSCSRTCGGGMRYRRRTCTNPSPANGGRPCDGGATIAISCNEHGCPGKTINIPYMSNKIVDETLRISCISFMVCVTSCTLREGMKNKKL